MLTFWFLFGYSFMFLYMYISTSTIPPAASLPPKPFLPTVGSWRVINPIAADGGSFILFYRGLTIGNSFRLILLNLTLIHPHSPSLFHTIHYRTVLRYSHRSVVGNTYSASWLVAANDRAQPSTQLLLRMAFVLPEYALRSGSECQMGIK